MMMRVALLLLPLAAVCNAILPEIVDSGISHILQDHSDPRQTEPDRVFVQVEQLPEDPQQKPEDAFQQRDNVSLSQHPTNLPPTTILPPSHHNETVTGHEAVQTSVEQETNNITRLVQPADLENNIDAGCVTNEDCGTGRFCLHAKSRCLPCKAVDVPCTKDEECCGEQLCVWGQCTQNATKGESGCTCRYQADCSPDLCCALHRALLFPVCSAKPVERERCFGPSNHLVELLSWDIQDEGPRKYCPCAGDLHCQHLGRGSMCLKGEDSSEEDLTDTLYSEIDYII